MTTKKNSDDLWENDASLIPMTSERETVINDMLFRFMKSRKLSPDEAFPRNPARSEIYAAWLKDHTDT